MKATIGYQSAKVLKSVANDTTFVTYVVFSIYKALIYLLPKTQLTNATTKI